MVESAKRNGEIALGFRHWAEAGDAAKKYGVRLNPTKTEKITFREGDRIVVVAEDYITE